MNYDDVVVRKPWGWETAIWQNEHLAIWYLNINHRHKTSLHSHPLKKTGLVVLSGIAEVSFMNGKHMLKPSQKIMIRNGVFHSTEALSDLQLIEVETPNDKENILRLEDSYGRAGQPYEDSSHHSKDIKQIKLEENTVIGDCSLSIKNLKHWNELDKSKSNIIILEGRIFYQQHPVCEPGDVVDNETFTRLAAKFEFTPMKILEIKLV
jgi:mannose-6-phosphate isomerase-like protein (cupin superfamily)